MYQRIHDTLHRQQQGLRLLCELLEEEYGFLLRRDIDAVVALEFSVHELVRQLAQEKALIIRLLDGGKVMVYAELLPAEQGDALRALYNNIDDAEQSASRQASTNAELSLALLDQSQRTMQELHKQLVPVVTQTYGRRGAMGTHRPQASIISGRL